MEKLSHKAALKESSSKLDIFSMQTEIALINSMLRSKTLTSIVVVGILFFTGLLYFLYKMAGA